jgi:hypothetical protein
MSISLTKKSKIEIFNRHNGTGAIVLKTKDNEIVQFDIWLGMNGKFYANPNNPDDLMVYLDRLKKEGY